MLTEEERKKIAAAAVRRAEISHIMATRTWSFEARVGSENHRDENIRFLNGNDNQQADLAYATLLYDCNMWKRRAEKHGCNVEGTDADCG